MSRLSQDEFDGQGVLLNGFDYDNQAWVKDGKYIRCGHPESMTCGCFGREHAGEPVRVSVETIQLEGSDRPIPETIRLADASGLTVRVTIEDERFTRTVIVSGCVTEEDAVSAVSPYLNSNYLKNVETEVL